VRHLVETAFGMAGKKIFWRGDAGTVSEEGLIKDEATGVEKVVVVVDPNYYRPTEVETLLGDPTKAKEKMGWVPQICFEELIYDMMNHDFQMYGMQLPPAALDFIPGKKLTKEFTYPDLMVAGIGGDRGGMVAGA